MDDRLPSGDDPVEARAGGPGSADDEAAVLDVLVVNITQALRKGDDVLTATQGNWVVAPHTAERLRFVIGVSRGSKVEGVFRVVGFEPVEIPGERPRMWFRLEPSSRRVVVDLPRMYGTLLRVSSREVFADEEQPHDLAGPVADSVRVPGESATGPAVELADPLDQVLASRAGDEPVQPASGAGVTQVPRSRAQAALVADLEPRLVGDIVGGFFVPAYQRGYRWGEVEVGRLLDDIWESRDRPYYLQPIVVKRHGDEWELVDGQQRLTTLFLIFQYMLREGLQGSGAAYTLRYETRPDSAEYLEDPDPARSQDNIDFFHIHQAYECISGWFAAHGPRRQYVANRFYSALFESVRVIWYEAPHELDATTLFTRLNVGRIPLDDAELVKALLLARARGERGGTDRALEVAAQWDVIEQDLRDPELWAFITRETAQRATHISLLLDTLAGGPTGRDRPPFHTFETLRQRIAAEPLAFWEEVVSLHSQLVWWYDNRDLFHKIGFLVAEGTGFPELVQRSRAKRKSEFEAELDGLIRTHLRLTESELRDLDYEKKDRTARVLLLMNVETIRRRQHSTERYSFREHALGRWSLEHIHAQNAEPLTRVEQWEQWLGLHRRALAARDDLDPARREALLTGIDQALAGPPMRAAEFRALEREVVALLSTGADPAEGDVDSIANLALLHGGDNSALSNSVFAVKRAEILERDRAGSYIPVCTRDVFLKYYSPAGEQQMHFWSAEDRRHYLDAMVEVLTPYLMLEEADQ